MKRARQTEEDRLVERFTLRETLKSHAARIRAKRVDAVVAETVERALGMDRAAVRRENMWTLSEGNGDRPLYTTEASDLEVGAAFVMACLDCGAGVAAWKEEKDRENELVATTGTCSKCGALYTIFND